MVVFWLFSKLKQVCTGPVFTFSNNKSLICGELHFCSGFGCSLNVNSVSIDSNRFAIFADLSQLFAV